MRDLNCTGPKFDWMQTVVDACVLKAGDDEEVTPLLSRFKKYDKSVVEEIDDKFELDGKFTQLMQIDNYADLASADTREAENEMFDKV